MATILIIDSYQCVRDLVEMELVADGHTVVGTGDLSSVSEIIQCFEPALIILDLFHGKKERWDLLFDLKRQHPSLPMIIFTACDQYKKDHRMMQADGFVLKSLFFDELKRQVAEVLDLEGLPIRQRKDGFAFSPIPTRS